MVNKIKALERDVAQRKAELTAYHAYLPEEMFQHKGTELFSVMDFLAIRSDTDLRCMLSEMAHFQALPEYAKRSVLGKGSLDSGAIYYQACQAMDGSNRTDDLQWALEQLEGLGNYKDAQMRAQTCKERLQKQRR